MCVCLYVCVCVVQRAYKRRQGAGHGTVQGVGVEAVVVGVEAVVVGVEAQERRAGRERNYGEKIMQGVGVREQNAVQRDNDKVEKKNEKKGKTEEKGA